MLQTTVVAHVLAGCLGLISGYVALFAAKGATLHRKSGMIFVFAMLPMAVTGLLISAFEGVAPAINIPSAVLTFYLVVTALTTVRSPAQGSRRLGIAGMLMALAVGLSCVALALVAIARGGAGAGMAYPLFLFGGIALVACAGDFRMLRAGGVQGAARLKRHLWRMCFALFIAALAFFSSARRVPAPGLLRALPVLAVLLTMVYWLWRLRVKQTFSRVSAIQAIAAQPSR